MKIPPELFDQFYTPLVGNDAAVGVLKEDLTQHVHAPYDGVNNPDPYLRLQMGAIEAVKQTVHKQRTTSEGDSEASKAWMSIEKNGILGVMFTVATLSLRWFPAEMLPVHLISHIFPEYV